MINSDIKRNVVAENGTSMAACLKQPSIAPKKIALRDVHNNSTAFTPMHQEISPLLEGKPLTDAIKICRTKRLRPDQTSNHPLPPLISRNHLNEQFKHAFKKLESEFGKGIANAHDLRPKGTEKGEKNLHFPSAVNSKFVSSNPRDGRSSVPNFFSKTGARALTPQSKLSNDQQREERFVHLQNFLKHCDESNPRETTQMLLHLSPAELSRHAVELEKRAIQLTIEEGKEMQRMRVLKILGRSPPTMDYPLAAPPLLQSKS